MPGFDAQCHKPPNDSDGMYQSLNQLKFDNRFVAELPADPERTITPRQVFNACYSFVTPTAVKAPQLIAYSKALLAQLNLAESVTQSAEFAAVFSGNKQLSAMQPFAMCYGGHQFGHWAGQLGDGRAINLGEVMVGSNKRLTLQLKGAGMTPYSRSADGLAVLRSSVREFLCSEAMHHLGIATTRALSLVATGEQVVRDMFYDGNPAYEPTAIVCRVAPSFVRFGNFQIFATRGEYEVLKQLVDYTIRHDFPELGEPSKAVYLKWFETVCQRTADMVVDWMRVGFVHGVMNTDNLSILGLTIDYGPYGWLEDYDPTWTPNTTDAGTRRYCYGNQPQIARWNLFQLANAIVPLIEETAGLEQILADFVDYYQQRWLNVLANKVGFSEFKPQRDDELLEQLLALLPRVETDMTLFFRHLADIDSSQHYSGEALEALIEPAYYKPQERDDEYRHAMRQWLLDYHQALKEQGLDHEHKKQQMNRINPKYVLRNYLAQQAIDKAHEGDYGMINELLEVLKRPYDEQPEFNHYAAKRPEWARVKAGCSMLSCSS